MVRFLGRIEETGFNPVRPKTALLFVKVQRVGKLLCRQIIVHDVRT
jgi:hypothetical protein